MSFYSGNKQNKCGYLYLIQSTKFNNSYKIGKTVDINNRFFNHLYTHKNNIALLLYGENNNINECEKYLIKKWYEYSNYYNYNDLKNKLNEFKEPNFFGSLCSKEYFILNDINLFSLIQDFNNICNNLDITNERLKRDLKNNNLLKNINLIKYSKLKYDYQSNSYYAYQPSRSHNIILY